MKRAAEARAKASTKPVKVEDKMSYGKPKKKVIKVFKGLKGY